jgi:hypothetical protein
LWILASAARQTSRTGTEKIASQQVEIKQEGDRMQIATITRGLPRAATQPGGLVHLGV